MVLPKIPPRPRKGTQDLGRASPGGSFSDDGGIEDGDCRLAWGSQRHPPHPRNTSGPGRGC